MFLFDHGSLPQVGRAAPHVVRDIEHLRRSVRAAEKRQRYAERQQHREAEINGLKRSFEIFESEICVVNWQGLLSLSCVVLFLFCMLFMCAVGRSEVRIGSD